MGCAARPRRPRSSQPTAHSQNDPLQGHASCDHTTLLLNCYTKLKDVAKLEAFIQGDGRLERGALNFDVDTAIKARGLVFNSKTRTRNAASVQSVQHTLCARDMRSLSTVAHQPPPVLPLPPTAAQVCRSAGYFEHALYVALAAGESRAYLDILLEDCQRCGPLFLGADGRLLAEG